MRQTSRAWQLVDRDHLSRLGRCLQQVGAGMAWCGRFFWERPRLTGGLIGLAVAVTGWRMILTERIPAEAPASPVDQMTGLDGGLMPVLPDVVSPPQPEDSVVEIGSPTLEDAAAPTSSFGAWPAPSVPVLPITASRPAVTTEPSPAPQPQGAWLLGTIEDGTPEETRTASRFDELGEPTRY